MALTAWVSTSSEDFNSDGNWSGVKPVNGDDVVISKIATANISTNLDQSASDLKLKSLRTEEGCTVSVGGPANYLRCLVASDAVNSRITHLGSGSLYFHNDSDTDDQDTPVIYLDSPNSVDALFLKAGGATRNITNVVALSGFCSIAADSFIHNLYTDYSDRYPGGRGPVVEIAAASFAIEDVVINAGEIAIGDRQIDALDLYGGSVVQTAPNAVPLTLRQTGGTMVYKGPTTLPLVIGYRGVLDIQQDYTAKTITKYVHSTHYRLKADLNRTTITQDIPLGDTDTAI